MITVRADSSCILLSDIVSLKGYVEWVKENQASVILNNQRFLLALRPCSKEYRVVDVQEGWSPFLDAYDDMCSREECESFGFFTFIRRIFSTLFHIFELVIFSIMGFGIVLLILSSQWQLFILSVCSIPLFFLLKYFERQFIGRFSYDYFMKHLWPERRKGEEKEE